MREQYILKTTFRTHEGFTNAPSTCLMNSVFNPFNRKFVMVFLDDILIYNKSLKEHVQHVDRALKQWEGQ